MKRSRLRWAGLFFTLTASMGAIADDAPRYATTPFLEPDRCAIAWILTRRIDPPATIEFHERGAMPKSVIPFDLPEAEIRRDARRAAVEVLLELRGIDDPFSRRLAGLVHDIEIKAWSRRRSEDSLVFQKRLVEAFARETEPHGALSRCLGLLDALEHASGDVESWSVSVPSETDMTPLGQ